MVGALSRQPDRSRDYPDRVRRYWLEWQLYGYHHSRHTPRINWSRRTGGQHLRRFIRAWEALGYDDWMQRSQLHSLDEYGVQTNPVPCVRGGRPPVRWRILKTTPTVLVGGGDDSGGQSLQHPPPLPLG